MKKSMKNPDREERRENELEILRRNLVHLRLSHNWTIDELSEISGISIKILTDIEDGEDFEVYYFLKLCHLYQVKPHELFTVSSRLP